LFHSTAGCGTCDGTTTRNRQCTVATASIRLCTVSATSGCSRHGDVATTTSRECTVVSAQLRTWCVDNGCDHDSATTTTSSGRECNVVSAQLRTWCVDNGCDHHSTIPTTSSSRDCTVVSSRMRTESVINSSMRYAWHGAITDRPPLLLGFLLSHAAVSPNRALDAPQAPGLQQTKKKSKGVQDAVDAREHEMMVR
jgi:hypothetical protein